RILSHQCPLAFQSARSTCAPLRVPIPASEVASPTSAAASRTIMTSLARSPPTAIIQPPTTKPSPRPFMMYLLEAIGRARPDGRGHPLPLRAGAPVRHRLLDAAEAPEGHRQQHEPDDRHRPAEPEQARGGQREAHDEHEQIPPLCRGRSHALVLLLAR